MKFFVWFKKTLISLIQLVKFLYVKFSPIYNEIVAIIYDVKADKLENERARKEAARRVKAICGGLGIKIKDNEIDAMIQLIYTYLKWKGQI